MLKSSSLSTAVRALLVGCLAVPTGCALHLYQAAPARHRANPERSAIGRALDYLEATQVREPVRVFVGGGDWPGNWPQYLCLPFGVHVREVSPFIPAFIHASLGRVEEAALCGRGGLGPEDATRVRTMRARAVGFMRRFDATAAGGPEGAVAFWPPLLERRAATRPVLSALRGDWALKALAGPVMRGPCPRGRFAALNAPQMPQRSAAFADADDTVMVWAALMEEARAEGAPEPRPPLELLAAWRDVGRERLRFPTRWLERPSGLFLTFLGGPVNDVDLVLNANVLYLLARCGRLDLSGAAEAVAALNRHVERLAWEDREDPVTPYYAVGLTAHYCVARAFARGPVPALRPAAEWLAADVEGLAELTPEGAARWDLGSPDLDTALAVLALLDAGRSPELARAGARYLLRSQDQATGAWEGGCFFGARADSGVFVGWRSAALTTALAMEAILRADPAAGEAAPVPP